MATSALPAARSGTDAGLVAFVGRILIAAIFVPPQLAYDLNSPPPIPPGSLLIFDVDLLGVQAPKPLPQHPTPTPPAGPPHS